MLVLNFNGIGNGFMVLPLLSELERVAPEISYFHIDNPVFHSEMLMRAARLERFLGVVPSIWRRVGPADHDEIRRFIAEQRIDVIVSLRNEGPRRDVGFEQFRREWTGGDLEFWTLDQAELLTLNSRNLVAAQISLFCRHGIELSGARSGWLREQFSSRATHTRTRIGLFTGVSQTAKRWMAERWITLGERLLDESDADLVIYAGLDDEERHLAAEVLEHLSARHIARCTLVQGLPLESFVAHLATLDLLISNDTSSIHIAAALDLPAVGLYFSTVGEVWGGHSERFTYVQSRTGLSCPFLKPDAGNCDYYYGGCPAPCRYDVTAERVWSAIEHLVKGECIEHHA
jgi:ADP-heptose:LPS heptosyltransferase